MSALNRQIRDGGVLHAVRAPETAAPVMPVSIVTETIDPVESPARVLQDRVGAYAAGQTFHLPRYRRSRRSGLPRFILGALALWGCSLGGIGALLVHAAM